MVASIPEDREVLFCPDQFLGAHVRRVTGRKNLHVWAGECHVHAGINGDELADQARAHPDAELFVHPECGCATSALYLAGEGAFPEDRVKILSTGGMLDAARETRARQVLVATEVGMLHQLRRAAPEVDFRAVNDRASCKYMKMITPAALLRCLIEGADEVDVDPETARLARRQRAADDRDRTARRRRMTATRLGAVADVVVIGTGVAGLVAALAAHRRGRNVVVLSKAADTATFYAQGGIAVVLPDTDDSVEAHVADTLAAGGGLCDPDAVHSIVADGYRAVAELVDDGARFDEAAPGRWSLTREGGHSRRRIIHAGGDATGAEVQRALDRAAATLDIRRNHVALQVLQDAGAVTGVLVLNEDGLGIVHAPSVILATGGLGHLYSATTNPEGSTGDGIALALWAGVPVSDIEFIQFHPTMLFDGHAGGRRPLITEALRGEGAILVDAQGKSVTAGVHPMGDLAPRDVVAAAIDARLSATGDPCVYLDARGIAEFERRFPTVTAACHAAGIDPTRQPIPVVPGAHYSCGGVVTDVHGRTDLPGLFAAGEVARTGMHGANRLASNSLLEGLVVGGRAGKAAAQHAAAAGPAPRESARAVHAPRAAPVRPAARDDAGCVGGPRRRGLAAAGTGTGRGNTARNRHSRRLRGRCADRDRGRCRGCCARTHRNPRISSSLRLSGDRPSVGAQPRAGRRVLLMQLSAGELAEARTTISRALDEDLRYGPDVTTFATVPADATTTASMVTREPGVIAGVDVALLVLDEVIGPDGYRVTHHVDDGARLAPVPRC